MSKLGRHYYRWGQSEVHDEEDGTEPEKGDGGPDVGEDGAEYEGVGANGVHHVGVPCRLQVPKHDVAYPAKSDLPLPVGVQRGK